MEVILNNILNNLITGILVVVSTNEFETFFKLIMAAILAGIIGYERENWSKPAGFRTHVLVGISATMVMVCGEYLHETTGADPTRIPAQLLSGIGFLGAGTILRDGTNVRGLTTAAGLLAITCISLSVGAGYYIGSIIATLVVYIVLSYSHKFSAKLERFTSISLKVITDNPKEMVSKLENIINRYAFNIDKIKIIENDEKNDISYIIVEGKAKEDLNKNKLMTEIISLDNIKQVVEV